MKKKIFSICLSAVVLVALIAVLLPGCTEPGDGATYDLTMAVNPAACGTATDETGGSPYEEDAVVDIKAVPDCCRFVSWTAPAGTFGNATAAETTFTMPARNVTVTANFEPIPLDHFWCYWAEWADEPPMYGEPVQLEDQFTAEWLGESLNATVLEPWLFGNPVEKVHDVTTPISDPDNHLTLYAIDYEEMPGVWEVTVNNQFGNDQLLLVEGPYWLAVPTQKGDHDEPVCLDHFLVYDVVDYMGAYPGVPVLLSDQFSLEPVEKTVKEPWYFANPVQKTHDGEITDIKNDDHLVFYEISGGAFFMEDLSIVNQFGPQLIDVYESEGDILGVPSVKIAWIGGP